MVGVTTPESSGDKNGIDVGGFVSHIISRRTGEERRAGRGARRRRSKSGGLTASSLDDYSLKQMISKKPSIFKSSYKKCARSYSVRKSKSSTNLLALRAEDNRHPQRRQFTCERGGGGRRFNAYMQRKRKSRNNKPAMSSSFTHNGFASMRRKSSSFDKNLSSFGVGSVRSDTSDDSLSSFAVGSVNSDSIVDKMKHLDLHSRRKRPSKRSRSMFSSSWSSAVGMSPQSSWGQFIEFQESKEREGKMARTQDDTVGVKADGKDTLSRSFPEASVGQNYLDFSPSPTSIARKRCPIEIPPPPRPSPKRPIWVLATRGVAYS